MTRPDSQPERPRRGALNVRPVPAEAVAGPATPSEASPAQPPGESPGERSIVILELDAVARGNSVDNTMLLALAEALAPWIAEPASAPGAIILRGAGERHFCTGYNLDDLLDEVAEPEGSISDEDAHPLELALRALDEVPCPTIARLRGPAFGAGCELALTCDLRIGDATARFCMPPAKLGVLYSLSGIRRLTELVGPALAREMLFTAAPVEAGRALARGLLNELVEPAQLDGRCLAQARRIAANAPLAVRHTKRLIREFLPRFHDLDEDDRAELKRLRDECFSSRDFKAAVKAFKSREPVRFEGR